MVRFMKHYVTDGTRKARVHYSAATLTDGRECVTLYAKSFEDGRALAGILPATYKNDTDLQTDYFEKGLARVFKSDALYPAVTARYEANQAARPCQCRYYQGASCPKCSGGR